MALIDMTKPYIMVDRIFGIKIEGTDLLQIEFKLNGCVNITEVSYSLNGVKTTLNSTDTYCNYLLPEDKTQTMFSLQVDPADVVVLYAIVDQEWCDSVDADNVAPEGDEFIDDPRTHFVRLRTTDEYDIEHEGKYIKSTRIIEKDVTEFLAIALEQGELTSADILDIEHLEDVPDNTPDEPTTVSELSADLFFGGIN